MSRQAEKVYRANEWVWWRTTVTQYRDDWISTRRDRLERDLTELIGILAEAMGYGKP